MDTNVLLRLSDRTHPLHPSIRATMQKLRHDGHRLQITPQNCVEFWNVATRPSNRNGFGLSPNSAHQLLRLIERLFSLLPDMPTMYTEWRRLVLTFNVSGVQVHDARLVAAMKEHGVTHILTLNTTDFVR
ncbi:MAG TPA: type II toxin-antitoxin system VapC family toxin, partial [Methylococcales bacterium]